MMQAYEAKKTELFKKLMANNGLEDFRGMLADLANETARELTNITLEPYMVEMLRGQLSICYKIAEDADAALSAHKAEAKAQMEGGIPRGTAI